MSSVSKIILQDLPQAVPRPFQCTGDGRDGDAVALRDLTHGHCLLIVAEQVTALTVGQFGIPCLPHQPEQQMPLLVLGFSEQRFIGAAGKSADDLRIKGERICRDAPRPAQRAGDQCTSFAA